MTTAYWFEPNTTGPQIEEPESSMRDFRLPQRCKSNLRTLGILRSVDWSLTDVSAEPIESHWSVLKSA
jgi:hypothetical protein